jgi:CDP-6-deoxy-D-xylo-4-hexulose-3-dehydrase
MEHILSEIEKYLIEKNKAKKWIAGVDQVNYAGTYYNEKEIVAAVQTLLNGWMGLGKDAIHFESQFSKFLGKKFGALVNSGSSANLLMYSALRSKNAFDLPPGSKILTPVAGFPTTINPIIQLGFEPVFVDIELDTLNIDLKQVEHILQRYGSKSNIKAISFAHVLGNPPNMDKVMKLCEKYDLILLEDCCDALGSLYDGNPLGSFGKMASCSFYPAHHISLGEGGFVATNDIGLNDVIHSLRDWGRACYCQGEKANKLPCGTCGKRFSSWLPELPNEIFDHKYVYSEIGYNLKPIELQASIGLQQIKKIPNIIERRKHNYEMLRVTYDPYEKYFIIPKATPKSDPSWFAFPLTVKPDAPFTRKEFVAFLEECKIQTRPYFAGNILLQPGYSHLASEHSYDVKKDFPNATYTTTSTFFHGTSPTITVDQLFYIHDMVKKFMRKYE